MTDSRLNAIHLILILAVLAGAAFGAAFLLGTAGSGLLGTLSLAAALEQSTEAFQATGHPVAPRRVPICRLQGRGFTSPYNGQTVRVQGVVVADFDQLPLQGFSIQQAGCDRDARTSDGVFIYLGARLDVVAPGDLVEVTGQAQEFYGQTEVSAAPKDVRLLATGLPLPAPVDLNPPFHRPRARWYYEALEGMLVRLEQGRVVGPTSRFGETWLVRADLGLARVFSDDPRGVGEIVTVDSEGSHTLQPPLRVGAQVRGLAGVLGYSRGVYRLRLTARPELVPGPPVVSGRTKAAPKSLGRPAPRRLAFQVATFNLQNLFDLYDEPGRQDPQPSAAAYRRQLAKLAGTVHASLGEPTLIAVQEAENRAVLRDLAAQPVLSATYDSVLLEGPDARGIDVGLLYQDDRVAILEVQAHQGCTRLVDGLGPDGNLDVDNPDNASTCDTDGDGLPDGNRLFSRPPLAVRLRVCVSACPPSPGEASAHLWLLIHHWKSKTQDTELVAYTQPRRQEQARHVAALARQLGLTWPGVPLVLLGDFNDTSASEPLQTLRNAGLTDLTASLRRPLRYTFIYRGVSQTLDHVLLGPGLQRQVVQVSALHVNADYPAVLGGDGASPYRSSDHDPLLVRFYLPAYHQFLPLEMRE